MALNLRQKQTEGIVRMLNLNEPLNPSSGGTANEDVYKILIIDKFCQDILSTLIHVNDLHKHGVTQYLLIDDNDRNPVTDVPAVYFLRPTSDNINLIIADASKRLYDYPYLNFSSYANTNLLKDLASGTFNSDSVKKIYKIHDHYLEFFTLEENLFSLGYKTCYAQLNDPYAGDIEIGSILGDIVSGLFSVLATLAVVPVIRCQRGGPAELVAYCLNQRLQDYLLDTNNPPLFIDDRDFASSRPLLCLFDRNFDLSVTVKHDFSYRPLVHDVLGLRLNKLSLHNHKDNDKMTSYELDPRSDSFWVNNGCLMFHDVALEIESQLGNYKKDVEQVNKKLHSMTAVSSLPELAQRKKMIDKHKNIATALSGEIDKRSLDTFAEIEKEMMVRRGGIDRNELLEMLKGNNGTKTDKLRYAITYLISTTENNIPQLEKVEMVEDALRECEIDTSAFEYVKRIKKSLNNISDASSSAASSRSNNSVVGDWAEKLYEQSISAVTAGVNNLLSDDYHHHHQLPLTRIVESLMERKPDPEIDESYLVFDPKSSSSSRSGGATSRLKGGPFKEAIVFMIGGGNYVEYASLQELALHQQPVRHIIYGTTEILSGGEFVEQLSFLGHKMGLGSSGRK